MGMVGSTAPFAGPPQPPYDPTTPRLSVAKVRAAGTKKAQNHEKRLGLSGGVKAPHSPAKGRYKAPGGNLGW